MFTRDAGKDRIHLGSASIEVGDRRRVEISILQLNYSLQSWRSLKFINNDGTLQEIRINAGVEEDNFNSLIHLKFMTSSANINPPIEGKQEKQECKKASEQEDFHVPYCLGWAISRTKKQPTFLGHVAIAVCLAIFVVGGYWVLFWFAGTKEAEWLGTGNQLQPEAIQANVEQLSATPAEQTRLIAQFQEIETRATRHARIMGFFYKQYYISLSMIVAAAVVASICLFFISKSGWEKANNAVINVFIFSSAIILFYGNLTFVFKQDENLRGNQELYLSYLALREEVMTYWATQRISMSEEPLGVTQFILYLDSKLQMLNRIELGFSSPQIPTFVDQLKFDESGNSLSHANPLSDAD